MQIVSVKPIEQDFNIAIVVSRFNENITQKLLEGALERLEEVNFPKNNITVAKVPGAVEIPITAQRLAQTGQYAVVVCLGAVIYGQTKHFDYVCDQVTQGCQQVALTQNIPIVFGVLTTDNHQQALERVGGEKGHAGRSAIDTALEMVSVLNQIEMNSYDSKCKSQGESNLFPV